MAQGDVVTESESGADLAGVADSCLLNELDFTDLYLSETGAAHMRGLSDSSDPLYGVPDGVIGDLEEVRNKVCNIGQLEREFVLDYDGVRYRVTRMQGQTTLTYHLRRAMFPIPRIRDLGIHPAVVQALGRLGHPGGSAIQRGSGLILVAGATGQGKTTTLCSLLQEYLISYGDIAVTIEDPPELKLEGEHGKFGLCYQFTVKNGDFSSLVREALRQNPRYIMLGEIRDSASAHQVLTAAMSGHVVLATIHGGSVEEALVRITKYVASETDTDLARSMLADSISAVLYQEMKKIVTKDGSGRVKRVVSISSLFFGRDSDSKGLRQKVRDGKIPQLSTDIELQRNKMDKGKPPIGA